MKTDHPQIQAAFRTLREPDPWFGGSRAAAAKWAAANFIALEGDLHDFWQLAPIALDGSPTARSATTRAMTVLLKRLTAADLFWEDECARSSYYYWVAGHTSELVRDLPPWSQELNAWLVALAASPNGRLREQALTRLQGAAVITAPVVFVALIRLDDWVIEVQKAASLLVRRLSDQMDVSLLATFVAELVSLSERKRARQTVGLRVAFQRLSEPQGVLALSAVISSQERRPRRAALSLLLAGTEPSVALPVVPAALESPDAVVRLRVARWLLSKGHPADIAAYLPSLLADQAAQVRLAALRWLVEHEHPDGPRYLREALLDSSSAVRELAIYHLRSTESATIVELYRCLLQSPQPARRTRSALLGLASVSRDPSDAGLVLNWASDDRTAVAVAALQALATWSIPQHQEAFFRAALSPSPKLSTVATRLLLSDALIASPIMADLEHSSFAHHRKNALLLHMRLGDKWSSLQLLLGALADDDERVRGSAARHLETWCWKFNRSFALPTPARLVECRQLLSELGPRLHPACVRAIANLLVSYE